MNNDLYNKLNVSSTEELKQRHINNNVELKRVLLRQKTISEEQSVIEQIIKERSVGED